MKVNITRTVYFTITLIGLFLIIPNNLKPGLVILFSIVSFVFFLNNPNRKIHFNLLLINSSTYIVYLVSMIYTENLNYALKHLETGLSLLVFPIIFFVFLNEPSLKKADTKNILKSFLNTFLISSVIYSTIVAISFFTFSHPKYPLYDANFFRNAAANIPFIGLHPIYSSMLLAIAILIGIYLIQLQNKKRIKLFIAAGALLMLSVLILLMSKGVLFAFGLALFFMIFKVTTITNTQKIISLITGFVLFFAIFSLIPNQNNRIKQLFNKKSYETITEYNSTSIRYNIIKCGVSTFLKSPVIGFGIGDSKDELKKCYKNKSEILVNGNYNSHNQYTGILLNSGLIGLLIFLFFLYKNFNLAFNNSNTLFMSILILFSIIMLFENILERQAGVIIFSFFINYFTFNIKMIK